ncbi:hypothetical protein [Actinomadura sp. 9N215]|uniref:hypothetical protein n=1 Tax=Actinomadura sp. 9N215 TaxID=3375150 RepID=UPI003792E4FD
MLEFGLFEDQQSDDSAAGVCDPALVVRDDHLREPFRHLGVVMSATHGRQGGGKGTKPDLGHFDRV